ncbi:hypothetical protein niasHT_023271 [Heterodera trifolii]|uniref:Uncharacterized protein n=1 Tax=Heterodera trifolii TaxID=157864 RepID=A0ABD2JDF6_9BILA
MGESESQKSFSVDLPFKTSVGAIRLVRPLNWICASYEIAAKRHALHFSPWASQLKTLLDCLSPSEPVFAPTPFDGTGELATGRKSDKEHEECQWEKERGKSKANDQF